MSFSKRNFYPFPHNKIQVVISIANLSIYTTYLIQLTNIIKSILYFSRTSILFIKYCLLRCIIISTIFNNSV